MTNIHSRLSNSLFASAAKIPAITAGVLIALSASLTSAQAAPAQAIEPMQVRTSDREVYGTREIESGNYAGGIVKLEKALARTVTSAARAPILINLCVAYMAIGDLDQAGTYCDQAVENGRDRALAYNNRGVLKFTVGEIDDSVRDLEMATKLRFRYGIAKRNLAIAGS